MIKKYLQFIKESVSLSKNFGMTYDELDDILNYITDEFPDLEYFVDDSSRSTLIGQDENSFIITFNRKGLSWPTDLPALHYVEPKIFGLINDVNTQLKQFGLYISDSDFGETDAYYELVVTRIGHEPNRRLANL